MHQTVWSSSLIYCYFSLVTLISSLSLYSQCHQKLCSDAIPVCSLIRNNKNVISVLNLNYYLYLYTSRRLEGDKEKWGNKIDWPTLESVFEQATWQGCVVGKTRVVKVFTSFRFFTANCYLITTRCSFMIWCDINGVDFVVSMTSGYLKILTLKIRLKQMIVGNKWPAETRLE